MTTDSSWEIHQAQRRMERRLAFLERLQEVIHSILAAGNVDEIMLDKSSSICTLFGCDRLTLYIVNPGRTAIQTKIKTGMDSFKDFELPITTGSIAGHVALHKRAFNIHNVYDADELRSHSHELRFLDKVDQRTGFHSREMVAAPILSPRNGELLGVLQLINNRFGGPFPDTFMEGAVELCKTLGAVFERHMKDTLTVTTRFDPLIILGTLAAPELELAKRSARRRQQDLEDVLIDEFQVPPAALGAAFAQFFGVPYEPYREDRTHTIVPKELTPEYAVNSGWLVLERSGRMLTVLALDPEQLHATRAIEDLFPDCDIELRTTTRREFMRTMAQLYDSQAAGEQELAVDERALIERVHGVVGEALAVAPGVRGRVLADRTVVTSSGGGASGRQITLSIVVDLEKSSAPG